MLMALLLANPIQLPGGSDSRILARECPLNSNSPRSLCPVEQRNPAETWIPGYFPKSALRIADLLLDTD